MKIKSILEKCYLFIYRNNFERKRLYLIDKGAQIGNGTRLLCNIKSFGSEPYLINIGQNCLITGDVQFLTHDGGISVLNNLDYFKSRADKMGTITIGNNVFIGTRSIIMPGVSIGNNVVIGAGSIVTKDIPENSVACGVPAKVVCTIYEYYEKCKENVDFTGNLNQKYKQEYLIEKYK